MLYGKHYCHLKQKVKTEGYDSVMDHRNEMTSLDTAAIKDFTQNGLKLIHPGRNHLSEPVLRNHWDPVNERNRFERRRIWTNTKQESFDLPEELKSQPEDNVFIDGQRSRWDEKGRVLYQRSLSMPAILPDVVQEENTNLENVSPDVLFKPDLGRSPLDRTGEMIEEQQRKKSFEGSVCYNSVGVEMEAKRKKSVSFDSNVGVSDVGRQARSHFRSSGYGSQSDGSQVSQASSASTEVGSVISDDALEEKSSFDTDDSIQDCHTISSIKIGKTDTINAENCNIKLVGSPAHITTHDLNAEKMPDTVPSFEGTQTCLASTAEELMDEMELWRKQMSPKFHNNNMDNIPHLSIFGGESLEDNNCGSIHFLSTAGGNFSDLHNQVLKHEDGKCEEEFQRKDIHLPSQTVEPVHSNENAVNRNQENKTSPTTKEECQRELFKRLFEERMVKFEPAQESLSDLLEWFKNNIGEALTPSPKSPFFTGVGCAQSQNYKMSEGQGQAAASKVVLLTGLSSQGLGLTPVEKQMPVDFQIAQSDHNVNNNNFKKGQIGLHPQDFHGGQPTATFCKKTDMATPVTENSKINSGIFTGYQQALPTILDEATSLEMSVGLPSSLSTGVKDSHLELLVSVSQCNYSWCTDAECVQSKKRLNNLKEALKRGPSDLSADDMRMLKLLCEHFISCDLPNCNVPWCRRITQKCHDGQEKMQQELITLLSNPLHTLLPAETILNDLNFVKLDSSLPIGAMPCEWQDWVMVCPLSQSFTVAKVVPLISVWPRKHWVVKMQTSLHEGGNQLKVLEQLRDLKHSNIVSHKWMAASCSADLLLVCTDFLPGISVSDLLNQKMSFGSSQTYCYLKQLLSATQQLHKLDIVYLNWSCSNLLLDKTFQNLQISNFTASVHLPSDSADLGTVKLTLPADAVPTELIVEQLVTFSSDIWGVACIIHEMLRGVRPWHHLRHCSQEETWRQIHKQVPPDLSQELPKSVRHMLQACLQKSPTSRPSVTSLQEWIDRDWNRTC